MVAVGAEVAPTPREPVIDPVGAVSGPQPPSPPDRTSENRALWFALFATLAAVALLVGVRVMPSRPFPRLAPRPDGMITFTSGFQPLR